MFFPFEKFSNVSYPGLKVLVLGMNLNFKDIAAFPWHFVFGSQTPAATHVFTIAKNVCGITSVWKRVCSFPKMENLNVTYSTLL